jgi:integrase
MFIAMAASCCKRTCRTSCARSFCGAERPISGSAYLKASNKRPGEFLFTGRRGANTSITTRQCARLVSKWIGSVGLDQRLFGTHSLRRTKATLIYRRTGNLRAVQLLLGHTKIESTVRYLGIEVDDALAIAEQVDV